LQTSQNGVDITFPNYQSLTLPEVPGHLIAVTLAVLQQVEDNNVQQALAKLSLPIVQIQNSPLFFVLKNITTFSIPKKSTAFYISKNFITFSIPKNFTTFSVPKNFTTFSVPKNSMTFSVSKKLYNFFCFNEDTTS
jgi:vesicle coat complex subunit